MAALDLNPDLPHAPLLCTSSSMSTCRAQGTTAGVARETGEADKMQGFLVALEVKSPPASAGDARDLGLTPGSGRFPGGGYGNTLQCSYPENPVDRGAWRATVRGITESGTAEATEHTHACGQGPVTRGVWCVHRNPRGCNVTSQGGRIKGGLCPEYSTKEPPWSISHCWIYALERDSHTLLLSTTEPGPRDQR